MVFNIVPPEEFPDIEFFSWRSIALDCSAKAPSHLDDLQLTSRMQTQLRCLLHYRGDVISFSSHKICENMPTKSATGAKKRTISGYKTKSKQNRRWWI